MSRVLLVVLLLHGLFAIPANAQSQTVLASWYGRAFKGKLMANGERFQPKDPTTAAHKKLPMNTPLLVGSEESDRPLVVYVKDRGPYEDGRELDLSQAAAKKLGFLEEGVVALEVRDLTGVSVD